MFRHDVCFVLRTNCDPSFVAHCARDILGQRWRVEESRFDFNI